MPSLNLLYRRNKIRFNFIPQITFNNDDKEIREEKYDEEEIPEEEELEDLETLEDDLEKFNSSYKLYGMFIEDLSKIKKTHKRKLELWVKKNKDKINILEKTDLSNLMAIIEDKYYL